MRAQDIKLIGETYDCTTDDKDWWKYEQEQSALSEKIVKKNARVLKDIFQKLDEQGVAEIIVPFSGGHDCGGFEGSIAFLNKKGKDIKIDYKKLSPTGWVTNYIPLVHKTKINQNKSKVQIFQYEYVDYKDINITDDWLIQKFYDFGFLEEWGSFAFEGHVSGEVKIVPATGSYVLDASESQETYDDKSWDGNMFEEDNESKTTN